MLDRGYSHNTSSPAVAGTLLVSVEFIAAIVAQFLAGLTVPEGENPDLAYNDVRCTVRLTGVIDIAGSVMRSRIFIFAIPVYAPAVF
jgi:hypothetical protein